mmetsp:Transcript_55591/g.180337  ORF Transcript_55591/g.180337 Transcript_55591/m.180337 type:complete len:143 (+) Transcript_55591:3266-3694(+)
MEFLTVLLSTASADDATFPRHASPASEAFAGSGDWRGDGTGESPSPLRLRCRCPLEEVVLELLPRGSRRCELLRQRRRQRPLQRPSTAHNGKYTSSPSNAVAGTQRTMMAPTCWTGPGSAIVAQKRTRATQKLLNKGRPAAR